MKRFLVLLQGLLVSASTLVLSACNSGGGGDGPGIADAPAPGEDGAPVERYALVTSYSDGTLSSYAVRAGSGLMRLVDKVPSMTQAVTVALRPGHDEVLALSLNGLVSRFQLAADGRFSPMDQTIPGSNNLTDMVVHPSGRWVYITSLEDGANGIYQLRFDEDNNGELVAMEPDDFVEPDYIASGFVELVVSRDGRHLYAGDLAHNRIVQFDVGEDGAIAYTGHIETGNAPYNLAVHPEQPWLYAANRFDGTLEQYRILPDGGLEPLAEPLSVAQDINVNVQLEGLVIDQSGRFLYVSDLVGDKIWQFQVTEGGALAALAVPSVDVGEEVTPRKLVSSPVSGRIYLSDGGAGAMLAFAIKEGGELEPMTPDRLALDTYPSDMTFSTGAALTHHVRAAYVINGNDGDISQFAMADDGTLSSLGDSNPATGAYPIAIAAHPSARTFYVANFNDGTVSQFRQVTSQQIDHDVDELAPIQAAVTVDAKPAALAVHPSGNFLYVVSKQNQSVSVYNLEVNGEIEDNNGIGAYMPDDPKLVDKEQVDFLNPAALAIDPTGRFLWVVNDHDPGFIVLFRIDTSDGSLTKVDGATESAGKNPKAVAINASGEVVYVAASGDNEIRSYSVAGDGTLTAGQSGFSGQGAVSLLASPSGKVLYVVNQVDSSVLWYGVSDVGLVSSTGTAPLGIIIDPGESHVLVSNLASANLTRFSVAEDGTLSVEETVATGLAPQGVAISGYTE